jgi:two-component system, NarL family, sensor histidine kinase DegS
MIDRDLSTSPDSIVGTARSRVESCRLELRTLLAGSQKDYRNIIAELDKLVSTSIERRDEPLAARVESLQHSKLLQRSAEELDSVINRLSESITCLSDASDALNGKTVRLDPSQGGSETSLEAAAIQAQEEERSRLAREIHDGPAQILANVALQLEYISKLATRDPARARDEMETIQKDLRLAVGEVRRFMYDLRPPALAQQGVGAAVESHCQRVAHRFGIEITIDWQSAATLPPSHDTAVFRIIQEALQNVVKHAQATKADVRAVDLDGYVEVTISDNGKGFEPDRVRRLDPKHFGLAGMRARAQQIGASLDVSSVPDHGTTVCLRVALT